MSTESRTTASTCRCCVTAPGRSELGGSRLGDLEQPLAELAGIPTEIVEPRKRREALEAEDALEERRRPVPHGAAGRGLTPGFRDEAALDEARDGRVGGDAADPCDVGAGARAEVRDDRERLERGTGEPALHRLLEQTRARIRYFAARAIRVPAGHRLEDDAAASLRVALLQEADRGLDTLRIVLRRLGQLLDRERSGRHDEERLHGPREAIDRVGGDQAERAFHSVILSLSALETLIGA